MDPTPNAAAPAAAIPPPRMASLDAYRGFVMLLMAGEVLNFHRTSENLPGNPFWSFLAHHQSHVEWRGCTLHDLIQPSFSFLVGCALPWSVANRRGDGQDFGRIFLHTLWRAFVLVALGVVLRSTGSRMTNFTFEDTLSQIGLGYAFLWLLSWRGPKVQVAALVAILAGYWAWFAAGDLPPAGFDPTTVGVAKDWPHWMDGFAAHWNKNANPAHRFDVAFLNVFPRPKTFLFNGGGYLTLSFIPTLATMILGLLAGQWLRRTELPEKSRITGLVVAGLAGLALGTVLDLTGICPSVKRIWTPSWVLFSGGWCALFLAGFHALADVGGYRRVVFPLVVVGMNSIFAYVIAHLWDGFLATNLTKHLNTLANWIGGPGTIADDGSFWRLAAGPLAPTAQGIAVLGLIWLCCWWLWKRKVFIRV